MEYRVKYLGKQAKCALPQCPNPAMPAGTLAVRGRMLSAYGWHGFTWHLNPCFVISVEEWWSQHPYVPTPRGRTGQPRLAIDDSTRIKRHAVLQKIYRINRSKLEYVNMGLMWRVADLEDDFRACLHELQALGGIPKKWRTLI